MKKVKKMTKKMTLEKLAGVMKAGFKSADKSMDIKLEKLALSVAKDFKGVDERFDKVDARFAAVDKRFDKVDSTMEHNRQELSSRLTSVERRTMALEEK